MMQASCPPSDATPVTEVVPGTWAATSPGPSLCGHLSPAPSLARFGSRSRVQSGRGASRAQEFAVPPGRRRSSRMFARVANPLRRATPSSLRDSVARMIRAALFDLGGTLYDYAALARAEAESLAALVRWAGVEAAPETILRAHRAPLRRVFHAYLPRP